MKRKTNLPQETSAPSTLEGLDSAARAVASAVVEYNVAELPEFTSLEKKAKELGINLKFVRSTLAKRAHREKETIAPGNSDEFNRAFRAFDDHSLLQEPFWLDQFSLKKKQRIHISNSYHLIKADKLKKDYFPGWGANEPAAALSKRAERNQILSILENGGRLYPIEQFDYKADSPKLTAAFKAVVKAFVDNGGISQEEMLYWLSSEQALLLPTKSLVNKAIENEDMQQGWETLKAAGPSAQTRIRPLDCLMQGDKETALRLFYDWTDTEQDGPVYNREELIETLKQFMAIERISIDDLKQG